MEVELERIAVLVRLGIEGTLVAVTGGVQLVLTGSILRELGVDIA